jgi:DNA invertase Pin-like site-specific DNA recombinase
MKDYGSRVLGIARRSNRKEDATTIPKIREALAAACEREGFELVYTAEDGGVSGKYSPFDVSKRKDLAPWLTDPALIARWDILMFTEDDRVVRKARFSDELYEWCEANGKAVMRTDGHVIDINDDGEWLSVSINALINEQYRRSIARKRKATAVHLASQGKLGYGDWALPYGFRRGDDDKPAIVTAEAEIIRGIAVMIVDGLTLSAVCDRLNVQGVPTRRGGTWGRTVVSRIFGGLDKPYARKADGTPYFLPEIITAERLAQVRAKLAERSFSKRPKADSTRHDGTMLLQVAFCGAGHPLYSMTNRGVRAQSETEYLYYRCTACKGRMARMDALDGLAAEWIARYRSETPWMEKAFIAASDHERELSDVGRRIDDLKAMMTKGTMPLREGGEMMTMLSARRAELEALPSHPAREEWTDTGRSQADQFAGLDRAGRNRFLRDIGARLTVRHEDGGLRVEFDSTDLERLLDGHTDPEFIAGLKTEWWASCEYRESQGWEQAA